MDRFKTFHITSLVTVLAVLFIVLPAVSLSRDIVLFSFERDPQGWEIPDWAQGKKEYVAEELGVTEYQATDGKYALEVGVNFSADASWRGAYVERVVDVNDWTPYKYLSSDIYLPRESPRGLRVRLILTVGEEWMWTEANKAVTLVPGEWVVLKVDMSPGSLNWRRFVSDSFRGDVKKIGIRIESSGNVLYKGPVYIDNVKLVSE